MARRIGITKELFFEHAGGLSPTGGPRAFQVHGLLSSPEVLLNFTPKPWIRLGLSPHTPGERWQIKARLR